MMFRVFEQVNAAGRKFFPDQWQIFPPVDSPVVSPLNNLTQHLGLSRLSKALLTIGHCCDPGSGQRSGLQTVMLPEKAQKAVVVAVPRKAPIDFWYDKSGQVKHIATQGPASRIKQRTQ